jgi:hypothetical protein
MGIGTFSWSPVELVEIAIEVVSENASLCKRDMPLKLQISLGKC